MVSWVKYVFIGLTFVVIILFVSVIGLRHSTNVASTQEVQFATKSAKVGEMRDSATNALDKKALVANLLLEIAESHKEQGKDIKVDYIFLDEDGNAVSDEEKIQSVQFRVQLLDEDGSVISTSVQRTTLDKEG